MKVPKYISLLMVTMLCGIIVMLPGCASTDHRMSQSSLDERNLPHDGTPSAVVISQPAIRQERAFRSLDLNADGAVTFDEWRQFDTTAEAMKNKGALDKNGDGQINTAEFLRQAPKHSYLYRFIEDTAKMNGSYYTRDNEDFQQPGLHPFSIHF